MKWRVIMSGAWTPSMSPGGARAVGCRSGDEATSIWFTMSSRIVFTYFEVTYIDRRMSIGLYRTCTICMIKAYLANISLEVVDILV